MTEDMTLRDRFASAAMQANIGRYANRLTLAEASYIIADAMMLKRQEDHTPMLLKAMAEQEENYRIFSPTVAV